MSDLECVCGKDPLFCVSENGALVVQYDVATICTPGQGDHTP